jgi:hypothetical protein
MDKLEQTVDRLKEEAKDLEKYDKENEAIGITI